MKMLKREWAIFELAFAWALVLGVATSASASKAPTCYRLAYPKTDASRSSATLCIGKANDQGVQLLTADFPDQNFRQTYRDKLNLAADCGIDCVYKSYASDRNQGISVVISGEIKHNKMGTAINQSGQIMIGPEKYSYYQDLAMPSAARLCGFVSYYPGGAPHCAPMTPCPAVAFLPYYFMVTKSGEKITLDWESDVAISDSNGKSVCYEGKWLDSSTFHVNSVIR